MSVWNEWTMWTSPFWEEDYIVLMQLFYFARAEFLDGKQSCFKVQTSWERQTEQLGWVGEK